MVVFTNKGLLKVFSYTGYLPICHIMNIRVFDLGVIALFDDTIGYHVKQLR